MAILRFRIVPNAKQNMVMGEHGVAIKIKLCAPAMEGKANAALRSFSADELKIPERKILLKRGQKSREKIIRIEGLSEEEVRRCLTNKSVKASFVRSTFPYFVLWCVYVRFNPVTRHALASQRLSALGRCMLCWRGFASIFAALSR